MDLGERFEREVLEDCRFLSREHRYTPTYYMKMVQEHGAVKATKILLASKQPAEGFVKLWDLKQLELSVEAKALKRIYQPLFSHEELRAARKRLDDLDFHLQDDW